MSKLSNITSILRSIAKPTSTGLALVLVASLAFAQAPQPQPGSPPLPSAGLAAQPPVGQPAPIQSPDYKLGNGDKVRITVFGQPDLTGEYYVDGSGMLAFPLIGQIRAGGLSVNEFERALVAKLKPDYLRNPNVSAVVLTFRPFYIVGEVKTPGSYAYVSGMTVLNAIAVAGGFTYRAKETSFYLTREEKEGNKKRLDAGPETPVQPGDVITVRERYF
jgi:polysaccharide export outer membrane protein